MILSADDDVAGDGSDRLIDALVAYGTPEHVADRVAAHHAAGADRVAVQAISADVDTATRTGRPDVAAWRRLAEALR